jgi:UDP-N-acetylglucosamine:LPS N-acetylglucosamine transferase
VFKINKNLKICFAASSGGHLEEITQLTGVKADRECFLITEITEKGVFEANFCEKIYYVNQINRRQFTCLPAFIKLFFKSLSILRNEKADCVITTGALMGCCVAFAGKLMKKKVIYIESFARIDSASLTGKLLHPIADIFIVQWEEGLKFFPKAIYGGGIF